MNALKLEALLRSIPVRQICANVEEPGDPGLELQSGRVQVAALVNTVAGAALDILKEVLRGKTKFNNSAKTELEAGAIAQVALPVALGFLHEDDEDISAQILKCVSTYVNVFAQAAETDEEGSSKDGVSAMVAILKAVEDRAVLPRDFDPHEFERRHPFTEVRRMLIDNVFRSVARAFGDLCTEFLTSLFRKAWASGNELSIELAFALLVSFVAEGPISPDFEELQQMVIENPPKCMKFGTNVSATSIDKPQATHLHQLELVSKHYFALVGRSDRLFLRQEDNTLFRALLPVFFDERGLGHKCSMVVRSSAAHALLKFTKLLRYLLSKSHLRDMIIAAEAHMFPVGNPAYTQNDQMEVFESVGYLLGTDTKWEESLKCLTAILGKVLEGFQSNDPEVVIGYITAAGSLSKGFGGDSRPLLMLKETEPSYPPGGVRNDTAQSLAKMQPPSALALKVQEIWINCLEAAMKASKPALQIGTQHTELRARLVGFLHRMVDTIGAPVLPFIEDQVGQLVHTASTAVELHVTLSLISQIVTKFAGDAQSIALSTYAPLVRKVHEYSVVLDPTTLLAISEESREAADMHRAYTYFLHALVRTKLFTVLLFPEHLPLLGQVMSYVLSNAIGESLDSREAGPVMKMSLHMLGDLVKAWIGPQNDNSPPGFRQFALKECANAAMTSAVRGTVFRVGDTEGGEATSVLTEIASLQQTCASHLGQDFARAVQQGPWNTLPRENVNDYLSALYSGAPLPSLVPALATLSQQLRILSNR
ncbi:unnamed protein product [Chondrus crispus]|uniref:Exportin-T n=1 Tax=Chondrus crispus TaxID=2769 RepID=R7QS60_CHOCR|nr:unnamed protein product [Chondrus crispus]CDF40220.1 unnamed protein product [Chondrus crispus]|eukprot:XP_005710514.1 unnamed protein product [Chondrus crispus]